MHKLCGIAAVVVGVYAYFPYVRSILAGRTKPHLFSWVVWGLLTGIAAAAQLADRAGAGVWIMLLSTVGCFAIAGLALRYGERSITRSDWVSFVGALAAIGLWIAFKRPLGSVILITIINALGFSPTVRKTWHKPHQEQALYYFLSATKFGLGFLALERVTWVTGLFPVWQVAANSAFIFLVWLRRRQLVLEQ